MPNKTWECYTCGKINNDDDEWCIECYQDRADCELIDDEEEINDFIRDEGKGNVRDALNIALSRLALYQQESADRQEIIDRLDVGEDI